MYFIKDNGIYRCGAWREFVWQNHAFGSRHAHPTPAVTLRQIHSAEVHLADALGDREREGDALITDRPGLCVGVRTADCVPLLILDTSTHAVAAVHAGWRGTAAAIVTRTLARFTDLYQSRPADLQVAIGPCIRACCYQVSEDVAARFSAWPSSVVPQANGKPHIDLAAANRAQLVAAGLDPATIFDSGLCTSCSVDRFFSFRREPQNPGRMLSSISRLL